MGTLANLQVHVSTDYILHCFGQGTVITQSLMKQGNKKMKSSIKSINY